MTILTPFRRPVVQAVPLEPRNEEPELIQQARQAYEVDRAVKLRSRELAIRQAFYNRFGIVIEHLTPGWRAFKDVWTFAAGGLGWITSDEGYADELRVWFCVIDAEGGSHQADTRVQLGELVRRGVPFERIGPER